MLRNFVKIALRNLRRQLMYSSINIIGLAVGMACSLVIFLYVYGEWSHDRNFKNGDRIYRIGVSFFSMGNFANGPELLGDYLPKEFDGVEAFTAIQKNSQEIIKVNDQSFKDLVYYVDSSFFRVFNYTFSEGDPFHSLKRPLSAVLTESMARKYFHDTHAIGKTIEVGKEKIPYNITAIVKDDYRISHLKSFIWLSRQNDQSVKHFWTSASVYNYVLLRANSSRKDLEQALERIIDNDVYPSSVSEHSHVTLEDYRKDPNSLKFFVHGLREVYLKSKLSLELSPGGNETNMYIFSIVALFILVLAGVNFINLSTARATRRAKEVGIRKSLGTSRRKLIAQFLLESVILSLFSMILALCFAELFSFAFFWITGEQLVINLWTNSLSLIGVLIFTIVVGVLAGIYPAFYLTSFQPVNVLKGKLQLSSSNNFRNFLVVFQFSISICLIICTSVIITQLKFMSDKDLGFNPENVITIDNLYHMKPAAAVTFKDRLSTLPGVTNTSLHGGEPGSKAIMTFYLYQTPEMKEAMSINTYYGDYNYLNVMGFRLVKGRDFNKDLASDTASIILNESAVGVLNLPADPIGAVINKNMKVIGVVSDFHWESLRNSIAPTSILLQNEHTQNISFYQLALKVNSSNVSSLLKKAEEEWKQFVPDETFAYHFMDDNFGALVKKEETLGKAIGFFTALAIIISCLGLFGLAAYTTDQRTKEIGIRKVLGASVANIVLMLNRQFAFLVFISMVIAIPVSYYAAQQWLSGFAYKTDLSFWIFLAGGMVGLIISALTVSFHSLKASNINPSETLKCE